jgi:hypothetical protein
MNQKLKKVIKYGLTGVIIGGSYASMITLGYVVGDRRMQKAKAAKELIKIVDTKRQKSLEQILNVSQKLLNECTYDFEIMIAPGRKLKQTKKLYFVGSAVGIHKNHEDGNILFLSCDHVTEKPKKIFVITADTQQGGVYKGLARLEDGVEREFLTVKPLDLPKGAKPIGYGTLKGSRLGIFQGVTYDTNGKVQSIQLDEVTELADTSGSDNSRMRIDNDDITLLRLNNPYAWGMSKYKVWDGPWGEERKVKPGQEVYAVGYPLNITKMITQGILSSTGTDRPDLSKNFYFTSAQLNPGNSGGGVWVIQTVEKEGKLEERLAFFGLGRLKFRGDGICGVVKPSKIKEFLRAEGYSYVFKKK